MEVLETNGTNDINENNIIYSNEYKTITMLPWTGKTKLEVQKVYNGSIDKSVKETMIYSSMENKEYISEEELNYLLILMRNACISEDFSFDWICDCTHINQQKVTGKEILSQIVFKKYRPITFNNVSIYLKHPDSVAQKYIDEVQSIGEKMFLELLFSIDYIIEDDQEVKKSISELSNIILSLPLNLYTKIMNEFKEMRTEFKPKVSCICQHCNKKSKILYDVLPNFEEEWIESY